MTVFYYTLLSTFVLGIISQMHPRYVKDKKPMLFWTILMLIILVAVAGLRHGIGDTGDYKHLYTLVVDGQDISNGGYEPGFIKLYEILAKISPDPQFMVFVMALITTVLNILILRKYYSVFGIQIYMYITSGYYLVTMNGIRQSLAAAFLFAGTKFIIEGKFIQYLVIVLFASTFHTSSIIMIPVYFIVRQEAWSKKIKYIIMGSMVALIFIQPIMESVFDASEGSKLGGYEDSVMGENAETGANPIRLIVESIPVVLAYIYREKIKEKWPESNIFVNMSLINAIIMAFSLYNWLFSRFNLYFQLYTFILLPYILDNMFKRKEKDLVYFMFILFYFLYYYYENVISLGMGYTSKYILIR